MVVLVIWLEEQLFDQWYEFWSISAHAMLFWAAWLIQFIWLDMGSITTYFR